MFTTFMSVTYLALPANRHNNQNKPTARGSRKLTAGLQKGEILGAGVGFEPTTFDL